ncbi:major facilitator superfamily domain-containing protein [Sordaria brevicollis]|uniref:Major facilitator superfamily domain-containing protein n=1 Tax=Sordaria brevicollis TaxID=83679 RepID=A0AAE0PKQ2_SORBR|nr:major facilitator superfamily domain-containing protein [Sordaria brevicollis]
MPHSRSLSEQSCLLANVDFTSSHEDDRSSRRGSLSPYTFPSHHVVHVYPDPEFSLPPSSLQQTDEFTSWSDLPNKRQLLILSLCRFSECLSNLYILPYLFQLVRSAVSTSTPTLIEDNDDIVTYYMSIPTTALVSTYSGALVACFPLAQLLVSFLLPCLERYGGRKVPITWSLGLLAVANLAFGFSRSFWTLLFWRVVSGLAASGNGVAVRSMAGEVVGEKRYQEKTVQVLSMVGNVGVVVGLAMGGLLAEPVKTMPGLFGPEGVLNWSGSEEGGVKWMVQYPFALPAVMNALLIGVVAVIAAVFMKETNRPGYHLTQRPYILLNNSSTILSSPHDVDGVDEKSAPKPSILSALTTRTIPPLISSFLLTLHTSAFTFLLSLHLSTPSSPYSPLQSTTGHSLTPIIFRFTGGLSLSPLTTSLYLSVFGLLGLLLRAYVYPKWQNRLSTMGLFELSLALFPFVYLVTPYLSLFSWGSHKDTTTKGYGESMKWIALGVVLGAQTLAVTMAGPSAEVLLKESTPCEEEGVRERVREVGSMVTNLAGVVGPVVGGVVYAKGVREGVVGAAWWFYLVVVAVVAAGWCVGVQGRGHEEREDEEKR